MPVKLKYAVAVLSGALLASFAFALLYTLIRPRTINLSAPSLSVSVVKINGENFVAVTGPPFNVLGAHQYPAYRVRDEKVELRFFATRLAFPNAGAFQADWPLLIPQSKFLSQRVRVVCQGKDGEELIATIFNSGDSLEVQRRNP